MTQCNRTESPVRFLRKTGTMPKIRRDFRHFASRNHRIWDAETLYVTQKARQPRAFQRHHWGKFLETGLAGWGGRIRTSEWRNQNPIIPPAISTPRWSGTSQSLAKRRVRGQHLAVDFPNGIAPAQVQRRIQMDNLMGRSRPPVLVRTCLRAYR
jgi:hypothetical protein